MSDYRATIKLERVSSLSGRVPAGTDKETGITELLVVTRSRHDLDALRKAIRLAETEVAYREEVFATSVAKRMSDEDLEEEED